MWQASVYTEHAPARAAASVNLFISRGIMPSILMPFLDALSGNSVIAKAQAVACWLWSDKKSRDEESAPSTGGLRTRGTGEEHEIRDGA